MYQLTLLKQNPKTAAGLVEFSIVIAGVLSLKISIMAVF